MRNLVQVGAASVPVFTRSPCMALRAVVADVTCRNRIVDERSDPAGTGDGDVISPMRPYGWGFQSVQPRSTLFMEAYPEKTVQRFLIYIRTFK